MKQNKVKRMLSGALAVVLAVSSMTVSSPSGVQAASKVSLKEKTEYVFVSKETGKALAVENNSTSNNAKIVQRSLTYADSQVWTLDYDDKGYYQLVNKKSGKAMDVPNSSKKEGTQLIQWSKGSGNNQKFKISHQSNGYYRITPKNTSNFGLNVYKSNFDDGTKIQQWTYHGNANELWEIREVKKYKMTGRVLSTTEAENPDALTGDTRIKKVSGASNGALLTNLRDGDYIRYVVFNNDKQGKYTLRFYYASAQERKIRVTVEVNSELLTYEVDCPSTGSWTKVGTPVEVEVEMDGVGGSIFVEGIDGCANGYAPDLDCIQVIKK